MTRCTCEPTGKCEVMSIGAKLLSTERAVTTLTIYFAAGPGVLTGVTGTCEKSMTAGVSQVWMIGGSTLVRRSLPKKAVAPQAAIQTSITLKTPLTTRHDLILRFGRSLVTGI